MLDIPAGLWSCAYHNKGIVMIVLFPLSKGAMPSVLSLAFLSHPASLASLVARFARWSVAYGPPEVGKAAKAQEAMKAEKMFSPRPPQNQISSVLE